MSQRGTSSAWMASGRGQNPSIRSARLGPGSSKGIDPGALRITTRVNGQIRQQSTTANMIFNVYELVSFVSGIMTLLPGDVIITGTPPGVGPLHPGDIAEIDIENIGILKNKVRPAD